MIINLQTHIYIILIDFQPLNKAILLLYYCKLYHKLNYKLFILTCIAFIFNVNNLFKYPNYFTRYSK